MNAAVGTTAAASPAVMASDDNGISWMYQLAKNFGIYVLILGPIWLLVRLTNRRGWLQHPPEDDTVSLRALRLLVEGIPRPPELPIASKPAENPLISISSTTTVRARFIADARMLTFCFVGLESMYLAWGVMQEKIMTRTYTGSVSNKQDKFKDAQFLVLANRFSAFLVSAVYILLNRAKLPHHATPGYKYAFASLSNILSSWCQYEALKFVSFPTQVIGKSTKIIPVMLLGIIIQKKSYPLNQYLTAGTISAGVALFLLARGQVSSKPVQDSTSFSGVLLIVGYLLTDSFTGNWQSKLFQVYKVDSFQMMCGVNLFSTAFTLLSELQQGSFADALAFLLAHPAFRVDLAVISFCSAVGQCFIFVTIKRFGAVTFAVMMTIRQVLAILLSCLLFGHVIRPIGILGLAVLFGGMFLRIWLNWKERAQAKGALPGGQK